MSNNGKHIKSSHVDAHCVTCEKVTEHVRNEFEKAIYYVCQTCATSTVAREGKQQ